MPPTVPAPAWRLWATDFGVRGGSAAPRGCAGAARLALAHLPALASPLRWGPGASGRNTSGPLPSRCAGRSRPPGSYGVSRPPRPSRRRGRPPALAPPPHRPGWAEDQPRPRPRAPLADPTAWRWPAAGGGCQVPQHPRSSDAWERGHLPGPGVAGLRRRVRGGTSFGVPATLARTPGAARSLRRLPWGARERSTLDHRDAPRSSWRRRGQRGARAGNDAGARGLSGARRFLPSLQQSSCTDPSPSHRPSLVGRPGSSPRRV